MWRLDCQKCLHDLVRMVVHNNRVMLLVQVCELLLAAGHVVYACNNKGHIETCQLDTYNSHLSALSLS